MGAIASQITSLTIVYSTVYSDRSKKTPKLHVTGLCFDDVIMLKINMYLDMDGLV